MRRVRCVLSGSASLAFMLTLAACGSDASGDDAAGTGENAAYTLDTATGETSMTITGKDGTATLRSGVNVPVSLPHGFSLFPGSTVSGNTVVNQPDGQGTMVAFEAAAPADAVITHYRDQAMAAGFDIQIEMNTNGTMMVGGEREADGSTVAITVTTGGDTASTGQIMINAKEGG